MGTMDQEVYKSKPGLPNKLLQADGTVTDFAGNSVVGAVDAYEGKAALPNKWLNPDGTYSTLAEIVASIVDTNLFIIVDELPETGESNKIYLLAQDDKLIEYIWVNNAWDPVGMVEFDINNYYTKSETTQLINTALQSAKTYADGKASAAETNAKTYADGKASAAETNAKTYADGKASAAETNAKAYADSIIGSTETTVKSYADDVASAAETSAVSTANDYTDTQIDAKVTQVLGGEY